MPFCTSMTARRAMEGGDAASMDGAAAAAAATSRVVQHSICWKPGAAHHESSVGPGKGAASPLCTGHSQTSRHSCQRSPSRTVAVEEEEEAEEEEAEEEEKDEDDEVVVAAAEEGN